MKQRIPIPNIQIPGKHQAPKMGLRLIGDWRWGWVIFWRLDVGICSFCDFLGALASVLLPLNHD
jgi:hypothetical protein